MTQTAHYVNAFVVHDTSPLPEPLRWRLPVARLTAFVAFRLSVPVRGVDDIRMTLRLPAEGMPEDRMHQVLRTLLDSPEKFLRFLRALLGGLDQLSTWAKDEGEVDGAAPWESAPAARPCSTTSSAPPPETRIASSRSAV